MNKIERHFQYLQQTYNNMPHGQGRLAAIQSAIVEADGANIPFWRLSTRYDEIIEQLEYGDSGKLLPLVSTFVTIFEEHPVKYYIPHYFAVLRIAAGQWSDLPQLPRYQWEELMKHFWNVVQRYQKGYREYYWTMFFRAAYEGKKDIMWEAVQNTLKVSPTDKIGYCPADDQYLQMCYALECKDEELVELVEQIAWPILNGTKTSVQEPQRTLSVLLEFAMDYKRKEEAADWAEKLKPYLLEETKEMEYDDAMLRWLAYENPEEGLRMMERTMPEYLDMWNQSSRFYFFRASWVLCKQLTDHKKWLKLKLPKEFPLWQENGQYQAKELADWFYQQALEIAYAFEKRDGYPYYRKELEIAEDFSKLDKK